MVSPEYIEQIKSYITSDLDKSRFSAFYNLFILPAAEISQPVHSKIFQIEQLQSLSKYNELSEEEMDSICSDFLVFRNNGVNGVVSCRVVAKEKKEINIPKNSIFTVEKEGKIYSFIANTGIHISSSNLSADPRYGNYFVSTRFDLDTLNADAEYNYLEADTILKTNYVKDSNVVSFFIDTMKTKAISKESNADMYLKVLNTAGEKTTGSVAGIKYLVSSFFPDTPVYDVYGNSSEHVTRNQISLFIVNDEWTLLNFKGKIVGNESIQHHAYEYLLTVSGVEYTVEGNYAIPSSPADFLLYEASQEDYDGLQQKWDNSYFITGYNFILPSDIFVSDSEWYKSDAYAGFNKLYSENEIVSSGNGYILGQDLEVYDYFSFIKDLMNSSPTS